MSSALVRAIPTYHDHKTTPAALRLWRRIHPQRRAVFFALGKTILLIAALWEYVWLWHTKFYSKQYPELPLSLAWSLLTVIGGIIFGQIGCSAMLKARGLRLRKLHAELSRRMTEMLAEYIAKGDFEDEIARYANHSTAVFEECITSALLNTRGAAHQRLCELPAMAILRDRWIDQLHKRGERDRRHSVEHLALLCDPQAIMALEYSLEDRSDGVAAAAIRGLLRMPNYTGRQALVRTLPHRSLLIRVLTAGDAMEEAPGRRDHAFTLGLSPQPAADLHKPLLLRQRELQLRAQAMEEAIRLRRANSPRVSCSMLAASGAKGRGLLNGLAAAGESGDAPAEALGGVLAAAARGGRA